MMTWRVGVSCVDITPPLHIPELGFIPRQHRFQGVHDQLFAKALAAETDDGAVIIVTADAIGFHRNLLGDDKDFIAEFRKRVSQVTGVAFDAIMLAASHAHSTPETIGLTPLREVEGAAEWVEVLLDKLVACAINAWKERKPAKAFASVGEVVGVAWSRRIVGKDGKVYRLPDRPPDEQVDREEYDPQLGVLLFRHSDGDIVLVNFTCHPTVVQVNDFVSADYPGALMRFVESRLPDCKMCLFTQGACGDVNPVYQTTSDFDDVALYGMALAGEVIKQVALLRLHYGHPEREEVAETFRRISGWRSSELKSHIAFTRSEFVLPQRTDLPEPLEAEAKYREALAKVGGQMWWMRSEGSLSEGEKRVGGEVRNAWERWRTAVRGRSEWERKVEVQVIALGELALVGISGELFVSLGLLIKRSSPFPFTFIVGYANGYNGYLTPEEAWKQGGYEVSIGQWAMCGQGSGEAIVAEAKGLLTLVADRKADSFGR
jgi:neutral ceramidase